MNEDDIWNKYNRKSKTTLVESELECQELSYSYPSNSKVVFKDISLRTCKGELVAIVGPSGTGKSTFLRVLASLIPPSHGRIFLNGREVNTPSSDIALIHQSIATLPWMTALDNIKLALKCRKIDADEATQVSLKMLDLVGLIGFENAYPKEMSGGMRQRIAIARALAASPSILLMDEPFVHLDELTANSLRREIYSIVFNPQSTLKSTILISHNLNEVVQLADRVYVMNGTPATLVDEMNIEMDRPRSQKDPLFWNYVDRLYSGPICVIATTRLRRVILPATFPYLIAGLSSTINSAWGGLAIVEYWNNIYDHHSLQVQVGMMKIITTNTTNGNIGIAAWTSLLFAIVVIIFGILFTRNLMDLARKKYVVEEGIYQA